MLWEHEVAGSNPVAPTKEFKGKTHSETGSQNGCWYECWYCLRGTVPARAILPSDARPRPPSLRLRPARGGSTGRDLPSRSVDGERDPFERERHLVRQGLIRFEDDQDLVPPIDPDRTVQVLEEFQRAEDFTDFSGQAHARFDLDPSQLEDAEDAAAARNLGWLTRLSA